MNTSNRPFRAADETLPEHPSLLRDGPLTSGQTSPQFKFELADDLPSPALSPRARRLVVAERQGQEIRY